MSTINRLAVNVPVPIGPTGAVSRANCAANHTSAPVLQEISTVPTSDFPLWCNQLLSDTANAMAYGGAGAYGIINGLVCTDGGALVLDVSAGNASCFATDEVGANLTCALTDNVDNYVWVTQSATPGIVATHGTLAPPYTDCVLIAVVTCAGGVITDIDTSGVVDLRGGMAFRATADPGMPGDAPSANTAFFTKTLSGLWLWTGVQYVPLGGSWQANKNHLRSGDSAFVPVDYQALFFGSLAADAGSTVISYGQIRVMS